MAYNKASFQLKMIPSSEFLCTKFSLLIDHLQKLKILYYKNFQLYGNSYGTTMALFKFGGRTKIRQTAKLQSPPNKLRIGYMKLKFLLSLPQYKQSLELQALQALPLGITYFTN